ncbi:MAG: SMC-Scp complex subunit ScpB [candidate division Zixibacteria bacterium]|nr:SMC-Scp complex subunit ScpB [Candidatus Tariuqbacter arcticus]
MPDDSNYIDFRHLCQAVEALLLSSDLPLTNQQIRTALEVGNPEIYRKVVLALNREYSKTGRSFEIQNIAEGYQLYTLPKYHRYIEKLWTARRRSGLTRNALETLAIIAYRQPVTRIDIEEIRGVNSDSVLHGLLERGLIKISGRQSAPGRPLIYSTTNEFLRYFGLSSLKDLPRDKDFPAEQSHQTTLFPEKKSGNNNPSNSEL